MERGGKAPSGDSDEIRDEINEGVGPSLPHQIGACTSREPLHAIIAASVFAQIVIERRKKVDWKNRG